MTPEQKAKYQRLVDEQLVTEDTLETYWQEGKYEGREEGREEGIQLGIAKAACNMFRKGMPIGQIALFLEISEEEVRDILINKELL